MFDCHVLLFDMVFGSIHKIDCWFSWSLSYFGLDSLTVKNISEKKNSFMVMKPVLGCRQPLGVFFKGGGVVERCVIWIVGQGPSFLIRKLRDKLCGKLAVRDLMHYRWVPYTSALASPVDERDWSVNCNLWHNGVVKSMNSFCVCMSNLSMLN